MSTWQALATLKATQLGLYGRDLKTQAPKLESWARKLLRQLGMTTEDIESDFPMEVVISGVQMIKQDPDAFTEKCISASAWLQSRN